jgi:cytochrome P450
MDDEQAYASLLTFFNAGYANTSHTLGKGLNVLLSHPEAVDFMARGAAEAEQCVEEILRFEPPGHFVIRYAAEEREIAGVRVPAGSRVLLLIGAANHDPNRYPDPMRFDPSRIESRPLTFGAGVHFCLGAPLTRMEGAVAFPLLFQRFPHLKLAGEPVSTKRLTQHGYHSMPVTF